MNPPNQQLVSLNRLGIDHPQLECRDGRRGDRATGKQQMHPVLALFAPDRAIERRERQTCTHIYRPEDGDPTHRINGGLL